MWFPDRLRTILWRCQVIVWTASWLVPRNQRSQWRSGRNHKFWHWCHFLAESGQLTAQNRLIIARHCWATFPEAFWTRFERDRLRQVSASPATLLAALTVIVLALVLGGGIVSATRSALASPVPHPAQIVLITVDGNGLNGKFSRTRSDTLLDLASVWSKSHLIEGVTPFSWAPGKLLVQGHNLPVGSARVGVGFFSTLGIKPVLGRTFGPDEARTCPDCVVLSYPVWQHELHSDPAIIGKSISLDGSARTVIGVLPPDFRLVSSGIAVWGLIDPRDAVYEFSAPGRRNRPYALRRAVGSHPARPGRSDRERRICTSLVAVAGQHGCGGAAPQLDEHDLARIARCRLCCVCCDSSPDRQRLWPSSGRLAGPNSLAGILRGKICPGAIDRRAKLLVPGAFHLGLANQLGLPGGGRIFSLAIPALGDCRAVGVGARSAAALPNLPSAAGIASRYRPDRLSAPELGRDGDGLLPGTRSAVSTRLAG